MIRPRNEHTIASVRDVHGRGYWSGKQVRVRFLPGAVGSGIRLVRSDLPGAPSCSATVANSSGQSMRTNLASGHARFQMIEHLMAALYALEIDNCVVEISGEELPGLDGSSLAYVTAIQDAGIVTQAAARTRFIVDRTFRVGDDNNWIEVSPARHDCASFEYRLDYGKDSPIQPQSYRHLLTPRDFVKDLAAARTFVTAQQATELRNRGIGTHVTNRDLIVFDCKGGVVDNELRYINECARHKTLDLIGDLALAGADLVGQFVSFRGGHQLNSQMATLLSRHVTRSNTAGHTNWSLAEANRDLERAA